MTQDRDKLPDPGTSKRRQIDRMALTKALADQQARDAQVPPATLLTTMGAIRLLGDLILDRRERGWTDAMLVAHLNALGLEISAETLCVYRARLKKERGGVIATVPSAADTPRPPSEPARPAPQADTTTNTPRSRGDATSAHQQVSPSPSAKDPDQFTFDRSLPFDDRV